MKKNIVIAIILLTVSVFTACGKATTETKPSQEPTVETSSITTTAPTFKDRSAMYEMLINKTFENINTNKIGYKAKVEQDSTTGNYTVYLVGIQSYMTASQYRSTTAYSVRTQVEKSFNDMADSTKQLFTAQGDSATVSLGLYDRYEQLCYSSIR